MLGRQSCFIVDKRKRDKMGSLFTTTAQAARLSGRSRCRREPRKARNCSPRGKKKTRVGWVYRPPSMLKLARCRVTASVECGGVPLVPPGPSAVPVPPPPAPPPDPSSPTPGTGTSTISLRQVGQVALTCSQVSTHCVARGRRERGERERVCG